MNITEDGDNIVNLNATKLVTKKSIKTQLGENKLTTTTTSGVEPTLCDKYKMKRINPKESSL